MAKRIKVARDAQSFPQEPKGPKKTPSRMGHRIVTQKKPTKRDSSLAAKVEGLAGLLRKETRSLSKRDISKGPVD